MRYFLSLFLVVVLQNAHADELAPIRDILKQPDAQIDLAIAKLTLDKLIDPGIRIMTAKQKIDQMAAQIHATIPPNAPHSEKLRALKQYLYEPSLNNQFEAYQYDLDDPLGTKISSKLLPNYINRKKGNCVSMPILFLILGQRLGLDVSLAHAPLHLFIKYRDEDGNSFNIETTSGGNFARDSWLRQQMPMTDIAISNGIYMRPLGKKEAVAAMMETLIAHYHLQRQFEKVIAASDLALEYSPTNVGAILSKASACGRLVKERYTSKYPSPDLIPLAERPDFIYLDRCNVSLFAKAETLGWREPTLTQETRYTEAVSHARLSK